MGINGEGIQQVCEDMGISPIGVQKAIAQGVLNPNAIDTLFKFGTERQQPTAQVPRVILDDALSGSRPVTIRPDASRPDDYIPPTAA